MNCYEQQYSGGKDKETSAPRSIRSQIGNSSARDWRSANIMPGKDGVSSQEYQKEPALEHQALYGQCGGWGWGCPNSGLCSPWQNAEQSQPVKPGNQTAEPVPMPIPAPGPVLRSEPRNNSEENPPVPGCPVDFSNFPVGMAYVPMQRWGKTYDLETGFSRGTIFPDLDLPFLAGRCI